MVHIATDSLHGKSVTIVGAGPVGLGIARELTHSGAQVQLLSRVIPRDEKSARGVTGANAAGYGAPFANKNQEILDCAQLSLPDWKGLAHDQRSPHVAMIRARTLTTDPETVEFLTNNEDFLQGPGEIGVADCYELGAFAFNPRGLLIDWVAELVESGAQLRQEDVPEEQWRALLQGENPFGTDIAVVCCGTGHNRFEPHRIVPVRGVLAHFKNVPLDLSRVPVSAMYEDDLTKLVYLIPRPGKNPGTWDCIAGGTFDKGEGECTDDYKRNVMEDRLVRARQLFAPIVPELIPFLSRDVDELSVGFRPLSADGAPIMEHRQAGSTDVFVSNGGSGQGWVTLPERSRRLMRFIQQEIERPKL